MSRPIVVTFFMGLPPNRGRLRPGRYKAMMLATPDFIRRFPMRA